MIDFFCIRIYFSPHLIVFSKANRPLSRAVRNRSNCTCSPTSSLHLDASPSCRWGISFDRTRDHLAEVRPVVDASGVPVPAHFKSFLFLWRTRQPRRRTSDKQRPRRTPHMPHTHTYIYRHNSVDYSEQYQGKAVDLPLLKTDLQ